MNTMRMVWWNVAFSPASNKAKPKGSDDAYKAICAHLKKLFIDYSCDLVALCEVSSLDITAITSQLSLTGISSLDLANEVGRTRFDIVVLYNNLKLEVSHTRSLSRVKSGNIIKAAQLIEVRPTDSEKLMKVYLCHWASRLNSGSEIKRKLAADIVYSSAQEFMVDGDDVIVMGDFNDNPYDESVHINLNSSRCHESVIAYPKEYFYNPFWRSIISENKYSQLLVDKTSFRSGTTKYKQLNGTLWHSYDQMLFSGSFLGNGDWHLNENATKVLDDYDFLNDFESRNSPIDHLPVLCELTNLER